MWMVVVEEYKAKLTSHSTYERAYKEYVAQLNRFKDGYATIYIVEVILSETFDNFERRNKY